MSALKLVIGNKNYSSWSLRAWLVAKHSGLDFSEISLDLGSPAFTQHVARFSPSGRVPALIVGESVIWDSLAIAEYLAELVPGLWPASPLPRAKARAVSAEMHSGFLALRHAMPMNVRAMGRKVAPTPALEADIARIIGIWQSCRQEFAADGPWLFGRWSIADAMYAPVVSRFRTYDVAVPPQLADYLATVFEDPALVSWAVACQDELTLARSEVGLE